MNEISDVETELIRVEYLKRIIDNDEIYFGAGGDRRKQNNGLKDSYFQVRSFLLSKAKDEFKIEVYIFLTLGSFLN